MDLQLASILPCSFQRHVDQKFRAPNDDTDKRCILHCNDKIASLILCTVQTYTSEHPAERAKTAHQTSIMNEPLQPTLKCCAEISLTTGRCLSPDFFPKILLAPWRIANSLFEHGDSTCSPKFGKICVLPLELPANEHVLRGGASSSRWFASASWND